jgi:hypothetical protein
MSLEHIEKLIWIFPGFAILAILIVCAACGIG